MGKELVRKKNFSVSMRPCEIESIDKHVEEIVNEVGISVSRNELIRRVMMSYLVAVKKNGTKEYMEVFKRTNT